MKTTNEDATCNLCVFCDLELGIDVHVCPRCEDYKGIVPARKCPNCGQPVYVQDDECPDCGRDMAKAR